MFFSYLSKAAFIAARQGQIELFFKAARSLSRQFWKQTRTVAELAVAGVPLPDREYDTKKRDYGNVV